MITGRLWAVSCFLWARKKQGPNRILIMSLKAWSVNASYLILLRKSFIPYFYPDQVDF